MASKRSGSGAGARRTGADGWEPPPRSHVTHTPRIEVSDREVRAKVQYQLARDHIVHADYHKAVQCLREAVRHHPEKGKYHRLLGQTMLKNPLWTKQAEQQFLEAIDLDAFDSRSCFELAKIYDESGLATRAANYYRRVLEVEDDNETARERLAAIEKGPKAGIGRLRKLAQTLRSKLRTGS